MYEPCGQPLQQKLAQVELSSLALAFQPALEGLWPKFMKYVKAHFSRKI